MTSVSAGLIILTPTQRIGSGGSHRGSNPGPSHQESCALPTELPRPRSLKQLSAQPCVVMVSMFIMLFIFFSKIYFGSREYLTRRCFLPPQRNLCMQTRGTLRNVMILSYDRNIRLDKKNPLHCICRYINSSYNVSLRSSPENLDISGWKDRGWPDEQRGVHHSHV